MIVRRDVLVPLEANPMEVYLLGLCAISGATQLLALLAGTPPTTIVVPMWLNVIWYVLLLVGGVTGVVGAFWRDTLTGLLVLRAAVWPVGHTALGYAAVLAWKGQWMSAVVVAVFGVACLWRYVKISRFVRAHT